MPPAPYALPELTPRQLDSVEQRKSRLWGEEGNSAAEVLEHTRDWDLGPGLRVRPPFSRVERDEESWSDRRVPPRVVRPSATRLMSSQGSALRFVLTAMAYTQRGGAKAGKAFTNDLKIAPGFGDELGTLCWIHLLASGSRNTVVTTQSQLRHDKKVREVRTALGALHQAGLVALGKDSRGRTRIENFGLLHEGGVHAGTVAPDLVPPYTVPALGGQGFAVPAGFITNGWVNVLADSEIATLFMVACGSGSFAFTKGWRAFPSGIRLNDYGIAHPTFTEAHKILERLGLLAVIPVERDEKGAMAGRTTTGSIGSGFCLRALSGMRLLIQRRCSSTSSERQSGPERSD